MSYRKVDKGSRISEYLLVEKLGEGGFGSVWKAEHSQIRGKHVAVKVPTRPEAMDLLKKEAVFQHKLDHPNIVHTIGLDTENNPPYFIMEFVEGRNLRQHMIADGILPPPYAIDVAVQVLEALAHAHGEGIIHKDIKPENIIVEKKRIQVPDRGKAFLHVVKITDFGFGKLPDFNNHHTDVMLSEFARTSGVRLLSGTLFYASPEQMVPDRPIDVRCDLYSLGVVLYEMLTGELPLGMDLPSELNPVVPPELDQICKRALSIDRDKRYETAREMIQDLHRAKEKFLLHLVSRPEPLPPRRTPVPSPAGSTTSWLNSPGVPGTKKRWTYALEWSLLVFVIALLGSSTWAFFHLHQKSRDQQQAYEAEQRKILSGPLRIVTSDGPAFLDINGERVGTTPFTLQPFVHQAITIRIHRAFHDDLGIRLEPVRLENQNHFRVHVGGKKTQPELRTAENGLALEGLHLRQQRGTLSIGVSNLDAVPVYIDDKLSGKTPYLRKNLPAGPHRIRLEMTGYDPIHEEFLLTRGEIITKEFTMHPEGGKTPSPQDMMLRVEFLSDPPGADLFVNEEAKGRTPVTVELPPGEYAVRMEKQFYRSKSKQLQIGVGDTTQTLPLERIQTRTSFRSQPEGATVHVDGKTIGTTPLHWDVEAGPHEVTFELKGHVAKTVSLKTGTKSDTIVEILEKIAPGTLELVCAPVQVDVYLGHKRIGRTPLAPLTLEPGTHRLTLLGTEHSVGISSGKTTTLKLSLDDLQLARIEGGEFFFGSRSRKRRPGELPQSRQQLGTFFMEKYEVTNKKYALFLSYMQKTRDHSRCRKEEPRKDHTPYLWKNEKFNAPSQPVVGVSYYDAHAYAAWAGMRLPGEIEWEKAARGTDGRAFPWGETWSEDHLNAHTRERKNEMPLRVGSYPKGVSPYDCHDMAGNVEEWTTTSWNLGNVTRGGHYLNGRYYCTTFSRNWEMLDNNRSNSVGFRCAINLAP